MSQSGSSTALLGFSTLLEISGILVQCNNVYSFSVQALASWGMSTMTCGHMYCRWCDRKYGDRLWFCHTSSMSTAFCLSTLTPSRLPPSVAAQDTLPSLFLFVKTVLSIYNIKVTTLTLHFSEKNIMFVFRRVCVCVLMCVQGHVEASRGHCVSCRWS